MNLGNLANANQVDCKRSDYTSDLTRTISFSTQPVRLNLKTVKDDGVVVADLNLLTEEQENDDKV